MKSYLNRNEKNSVMMLAYTGFKCQSICDEVGYLTKDERIRILTAGTKLRKAFESIVKRMGAKTAEALINTLQANEIAVVSKSIQPQESVVIDDEDVFTIADYALTQCKGCKKDGAACDLRESMMRLSVPVYDENNKQCQYSWE